MDLRKLKKSKDEVDQLIYTYHQTVNYFKDDSVPKSEKINISQLLEPKPLKTDNCLMEVKNIDCLTLAIEYGEGVMVLNMASDKRPGGGVKRGARAQEEDIFRRTNAFLTHPIGWYPLRSNEVIFSPEVKIVKNSSYKFIDEHKISMLACAGIRNPSIEHGKYSEAHRILMTQKIHSIFKVAISKGIKKLVLGALGCGAFHNPPEEVANIFKNALSIYKSHFTHIGFAVLCTTDPTNYETFRLILT